MRFMIIRRADQQTEAGAEPTQELIDAMLAFHEEMAKAGILLNGDGLHPTREGALITFKDGKPTVMDGPFAESKELIAGYTMIQVASKAEALSWVKRWPPLDADGHVTLELRRVYELEEIVGESSDKFREIGLSPKL